MTHSHPHSHPASPKTPPSPYVEVTFVFRDVLKKPIEGLSVQIKAGADAPKAPAWKIGLDSDDPRATTPPASAPGPASAPTPASAPASAPAATPAASLVNNHADPVTTDKDGYALTIQNAARNQPIDVLVKNQRGEYVWKAKVTPKKDISAFTIVSPEYHVEATTKLPPAQEFQQDLNLPVVKEGEVMTIERLVSEFGPYIGWSQKVTEQGEVRKDFPTRKKEVTEDPKTHKKKTHVTIEHHYRIVNTGKPHTVAFNVLASRLNYPQKSDFTEDQYKYAASQLSVEVAAIKAIVMQESGGHGYMDNGLPPIRYERHIFYKLAAHKLHTSSPFSAYPNLCFKHPGGYEDKLGPMHQYERLVRATKLDFEFALQACSWGGFQIMGTNYHSCGCQTVFEFADRFMSGTDGQINLFILFLKNADSQVIKGLQDHDWDFVAYYYNGPSWRTTNPDYAKNLAKFYEKFSK